jgi:hypothetical protein
LAIQFHRFDEEAREFDEVVAAIPENSKLMHLVVNPGKFVRHFQESLMSILNL